MRCERSGAAAGELRPSWPPSPWSCSSSASILADAGGALRAIGLAALAQGIGLAVALLWLAAGHNPLSRK